MNDRLPALIEATKEYAMMAQTSHTPKEMTILPSQQDPLLWNGLWFVHEGPYKGGMLKFNVVFPPNYPESGPSVYFVTPVFHPLVHANGLFKALNFGAWKPRTSRVWDLLRSMQLSFKTDALEGLAASDVCNKEAYKIYLESKLSFNALAGQAATLSQKPSALYDRDHWSLGGEFGPGLALEEVPQAQLHALAEKLGIKAWKN